jgi:hypothetical protein
MDVGGGLERRDAAGFPSLKCTKEKEEFSGTMKKHAV